MTICSQRKRAGFSLIEVVLALGVVSFCLITLMGLLPVAIASNQASIQQTAAANIASMLVADLRQTSVANGIIQNSPRFGIPIPARGSATHTVFFAEDGSMTGVVDGSVTAGSTPTPRYRAAMVFTAPSSSARIGTLVRLIITWPALADPTGGTYPSGFDPNSSSKRKATGFFETIISLDRN